MLLGLLALLGSSTAAGQCIRVVDEGELPREIDTPEGNRLSYMFERFEPPSAPPLLEPISVPLDASVLGAPSRP